MQIMLWEGESKYSDHLMYTKESLIYVEEREKLDHSKIGR